MIVNNSMRRRQFLTSCLLAAGSGMLPLNGAVVSRGTVSDRRHSFKPTLAMLTKADFDPCLGNAFEMEIAPGETAPLELIDVKGYPSRAMRSGASREPFALVFRGPKGLQVSQRIFRIVHHELGAHEIFLVPLGPDDTGVCLEAVFS